MLEEESQNQHPPAASLPSNRTVSVRLISAAKQVMDMNASIPLYWKVIQLTHLYKNFHQQNQESFFLKHPMFILFGKTLQPNQTFKEVMGDVIIRHNTRERSILGRLLRSMFLKTETRLKPKQLRVSISSQERC
jgi:hypothetical protein